ncbi:MAG TPA: DUF5939 domain-containing protein [Opitutus sp.]|nr:DUF5939 domain-containing protein [Opitutus sp.]
MPAPAKTFRWTFDLRAPPAALWPLVSNTDRFNRDCGYPPVKPVAPPPGRAGRATNARRLRTSLFGLPIVWEEQAFEWIQPVRFGVVRDYFSGPVARMALHCELRPREGGTTLDYEMQLTPAHLLGRWLFPLAVGRRVHQVVERVFRRYDEFALRGLANSQVARKPELAPGGTGRLATIARTLAGEAGPVTELCAFVNTADDLDAARMRPYALADEWRADRRSTLQLFLLATRAGLLDFRWELVCPHCRGATVAQRTLVNLAAEGHCPTCDADFTANFDQSVELTFTPNSAVRSVPRLDYCVGGPQVTPHIVAQQLVPPAATRAVRLALTPGRYRVRSPAIAEQHAFHVASGAPAGVRIDLAAKPLDEPRVAPDGVLVITNSTDVARLAIVEHLAWSDQATTAAEVTSLQLFRDLFSSEVLRRGEKISVGSITIVFTDLKNSTRLYQEIGDAPAFGRVLTHFEILKAAVADEGGAIIKTMGDAIMAVFPRPVSALRAMDRARRWLAQPDSFSLPAGISVPPSSLKPLALKAGLNCGPCLAINQNDRLDYFGSTVNFAARLCGLCSGADLILSGAARADGEVAAHLAAATDLTTTCETARLKGFGDATFEIWRVK